MSHIHHRNGCFTLVLILAFIAGWLWTGPAEAAQGSREDRPTAGREDRPAAVQEGRPAERPDRPPAAYQGRPAAPQERPAARPDRPAGAYEGRPAAPPDRPAAKREDGAVPLYGRNEFRDTRYHHDRVYPLRGYAVRALPRNHRVVVHGGTRYYFHGGVWYRSFGPRFTVIAPPIGLFVPFLPPYYATIWVSGRPYYYANEIYYSHRGDGYVVVEPPSEPVSQAPPPADQLFIYPRHNQSEPQQATDRYECHSWAVSQTGFDPTRLTGDPPDARRGDRYADYQRAMSACLDGRGYTVR